MIFIQFVVDMTPVAQPRYAQRFITNKRGRSKRVAYLQSTSSGSEHPVIAYKKYVAALARNAITDFDSVSSVAWDFYFGQAMRLDVDYIMPRPVKLKTQHRIWHTSKPDRDNLEKALKDSLKGVIYKDDCQICDGRSRKMVASPGENPHLVVRVEIIESPPES